MKLLVGALIVGFAVGLVLGYFILGEFILGTLFGLGRLHRYPWER